MLFLSRGKILLEGDPKSLPREHGMGSLEELFDPHRLQDDFHASNVPTKFPPRAVKGHNFGLDLDAQDRKALIAFLRTL